MLSLIGVMWLVACHRFEVEDPLYDIDSEQAHVGLQLHYVTHSPEMADSLPSRFPLEFSCHTTLPTWFSLSDATGRPASDSLVGPYGVLGYEGYAQPGYYRIHAFAPSRGYRADSTAIEVMRDGPYILRRPSPLFGGHWERQLAGGDVVRDTICVRQRTREVVFRILLALGDSIRYESSDIRLTGVHYRLDLCHDAIDPAYQSPLPLRMRLDNYQSADGMIYPALVDTINILTPTSEQYACWSHSHVLSVRIRFAYALNAGMTRRVQPVDCSFDHVLDDAYSLAYVEANGDPYCIQRYVWQARDTVTFHAALDTLTSGDILPWEILTHFAQL